MSKLSSAQSLKGREKLKDKTSNEVAKNVNRRLEHTHSWI
jgi:hypothetical protein